MAIENSVFEIDGKMYQGYLRVIRVWGSKREGWSALVGIAADKAGALAEQWIHQFNYHTAWEDGNPFSVVYEHVKKDYLRNPLAKVASDIVAIFSGDDEPEPEKPRRTRKKKVNG
jgi:hypothetical protein